MKLFLGGPLPLTLRLGSPLTLSGELELDTRAFRLRFAPAAPSRAQATGWFVAKFPDELDEVVFEVRGSGFDAVLLERNLWIEAPPGGWRAGHRLVLDGRGIEAPRVHDPFIYPVGAPLA